MFKNLQKHAPTISILLLLALIVALFFSPPSVRMISSIVIIFGIGTAIIFTVQNNWQEHIEGQITLTEFLRNTFIDLLGLTLVMGLAIFFGRLAGDYVGTNLGVFMGIIAGMAVAFGVAFGFRTLWGKVAEPLMAR